MKKIVLAFFVLCLIGTFGYAAKKDVGKPMIVFGDIGLSVSDFKGLFLDAGIQKKLKDKIFGEFLLEYYFAPNGSAVDSYALGFNLNGVYKHELKDAITLFGKAGISLIYSHASVNVMGFSASASDTNFGLNAGGGLEYALNEKMGLRGGVTLKLAFADKTGTWFKFYGGFYKYL